MKVIDKDAVIAVIDKLFQQHSSKEYIDEVGCVLDKLEDIINTLEVKEVDLDIEKRIKECPFRQVVCNRYEDTPVECDGRCSWVADYHK